MKSFESLVEDLKSKDSAIRDSAAIKLMDIGNKHAIQPLIEAISNPDNENYRGTLVYALSEFSCEEYLEFLVDLVLTGNFEVSSGAFSIIQEIELTTFNMERVKSQINKHKKEDFPYEHSRTAFQALLELVRNGNKI